MTDTIFRKILDGEIPCHEVFSDHRVLAFLDVNPLSRGHTLVIPREEAATMDQLSDEAAAALGRALPRICRAVQEVTGVKEYNILQNNGTSAHQVVMHVHVHIIPKPRAEEGLGIGWPASGIDHEDGAALAASLREAIAAG
ncbi:HIT domain-containing protein [bacterium]|nr:HIT domain-containing protein [bacterium]